MDPHLAARRRWPTSTLGPKRGGPVRRWVPKAYADRPVFVFETGGTTGVPKSRISIEDFRLGMLPLIVPLTLLRHEIRRQGVDYLIGQLYFDPHPKELMLRNHV